MQLFIYNRTWLENTISRLRSERRQIEELRENLKYARQTSPPECVDEFLKMDRELESLEESLRKTQDALSIFMNETERNNRHIRASYEEQIDRARHIFD